MSRISKGIASWYPHIPKIQFCCHGVISELIRDFGMAMSGCWLCIGTGESYVTILSFLSEYGMSGCWSALALSKLKLCSHSRQWLDVNSGANMVHKSGLYSYPHELCFTNISSEQTQISVCQWTKAIIVMSTHSGDVFILVSLYSWQ